MRMSCSTARLRAQILMRLSFLPVALWSQYNSARYIAIVRPQVSAARIVSHNLQTPAIPGIWRAHGEPNAVGLAPLPSRPASRRQGSCRDIWQSAGVGRLLVATADGAAVERARAGSQMDKLRKEFGVRSADGADRKVPSSEEVLVQVSYEPLPPCASKGD